MCWIVCSGQFPSLLRICRTLLSGCWVDSGLVCSFLRLGGISGSCLFFGRLSLDCCATAPRLVVVGRLCERITRGCMVSFCMVGVALYCGAGEVAGDGLCGAAGLVWLGEQLRCGAWVASGRFGSCLVLVLLSLAWYLGSGAIPDAERNVRPFAGVSEFIFCLVLGLLSLAWCLGSGGLSAAERNVRPFVASVSGLIGCLVLGFLSLAWCLGSSGPLYAAERNVRIGRAWVGAGGMALCCMVGIIGSAVGLSGDRLCGVVGSVWLRAHSPVWLCVASC
jgi:hypothetical protein